MPDHHHASPSSSPPSTRLGQVRPAVDCLTLCQRVFCSQSRPWQRAGEAESYCSVVYLWASIVGVLYATRHVFPLHQRQSSCLLHETESLAGRDDLGVVLRSPFSAFFFFVVVVMQCRQSSSVQSRLLASEKGSEAVGDNVPAATKCSFEKGSAPYRSKAHRSHPRAGRSQTKPWSGWISQIPLGRRRFAISCFFVGIVIVERCFGVAWSVSVGGYHVCKIIPLSEACSCRWIASRARQLV